MAQIVCSSTKCGQAKCVQSFNKKSVERLSRGGGNFLISPQRRELYRWLTIQIGLFKFHDTICEHWHKVCVLYINRKFSLKEGKFTKPTYEKPTALSLGEFLKGSGECNIGSAVMPGSGGCYPGTSPEIYNCTNGNDPGQACSAGTQPTNYIIR